MRARHGNESRLCGALLPESAGFQAINAFDTLPLRWKWDGCRMITRVANTTRSWPPRCELSPKSSQTYSANDLLDLARQYDRLAEKLANEIRQACITVLVAPPVSPK
jgi:hypothetical protein